MIAAVLKANDFTVATAIGIVDAKHIWLLCLAVAEFTFAAAFAWNHRSRFTLLAIAFVFSVLFVVGTYQHLVNGRCSCLGVNASSGLWLIAVDAGIAGCAVASFLCSGEAYRPIHKQPFQLIRPAAVSASGALLVALGCYANVKYGLSSAFGFNQLTIRSVDCEGSNSVAGISCSASIVNPSTKPVRIVGTAPSCGIEVGQIESQMLNEGESVEIPFDRANNQQIVSDSVLRLFVTCDSGVRESLFRLR